MLSYHVYQAIRGNNNRALLQRAKCLYLRIKTTGAKSAKCSPKSGGGERKKKRMPAQIGIFEHSSESVAVEVRAATPGTTYIGNKHMVAQRGLESTEPQLK